MINKKAVAGLRVFFLSLIVVTVCIFLLLAFTLNFIGIRNPDSLILNDNQYGLNSSFNSLNNSLSGISDFANSVKNQTASSNPDPINYVFLIFRGAFEVPISILNFAFSSVVSLQNIIFNLAGAGTFGWILLLVTNLIFAGLGFTLVFYVIRFIRSGAE
jgi:hypothetical protein